MKKSPERLAFMSKQLTDLDMDFTVQEGIDGMTHNFNDIYDEQLSKRLNDSPLVPVEKGCALSHRLILEKIVEEKLDYALILEDDVGLPPDFKKILDHELEKRTRNETTWEYLSFNYPSVGLKFIKLWLFLLSEKFSKNKSPWLYLKIPLYAIKFVVIVSMSLFEGARDNFYKKYKRGKPALFYRPMYLAGCYLVTQEGAQKLLSVNTKLVYPADRIQNIARMQKKLKIFWYVPLIVKQKRNVFKSTMYDNKNYVFEKYD